MKKLLLLTLFCLETTALVFSQNNEPQNLFKLVNFSENFLNSEETDLLKSIIDRKETTQYSIVFINDNVVNNNCTNFILNAFDTNFICVKIDSYETQYGYSYFGNLCMLGHFIISKTDGSFTGFFSDGKGIKIQLEPINKKVHVITKIENLTLIKNNKTHNDYIIELSEIDLINESRAPLQDDSPYLDILIAYTPAAELAHGNIVGLANDLITQAKLSYFLSRINVKACLAGPVLQFDYTESGSLVTDCSAFKNDSIIQYYRDLYKADISVLIVASGDYAGVAYQIPATNKNNAYCVVKYNTAESQYSFTHEIGHLQGMRHQYPTSTKFCQYCDNNSFPCPSGHGYFHVGIWNTMMAVRCLIHNNTLNRILNFSNPNVYFNGLRTGVLNTSDCASCINSRMGIFCNFNLRYHLFSSLSTSSSISIKENNSLDNELKLYNNYPNPFNPETAIKYYLPRRCFVAIKIFDILGNKISTLADEYQEMGNHQVIFDASALPSGIYIYRLITDFSVQSKKMCLLK